MQAFAAKPAARAAAPTRFAVRAQAAATVS
jgi:hypothetical protein